MSSTIELYLSVLSSLPPLDVAVDRAEKYRSDNGGCIFRRSPDTPHIRNIQKCGGVQECANLVKSQTL